jgi:aspartate racemase
VDNYKKKSGGPEPEIIIYSISLAEFKEYMDNNDLTSAIKLLLRATNSLIRAGADFVSISANTPHIVFDEVSRNTKVPMISIVEETAKSADKKSKNRQIGLLGTGFTMKSDFYPKSFSKFGLKLYTPDEKSQDFVHESIFSELTSGVVTEKTRGKFLEIVQSMIEKNSIDTLILGCTELPLIFDQEYFGINYLDTVRIHVSSIVDYCYSEQ